MPSLCSPHRAQSGGGGGRSTRTPCCASWLNSRVRDQLGCVINYLHFRQTRRRCGHTCWLPSCGSTLRLPSSAGDVLEARMQVLGAINHVHWTPGTRVWVKVRCCD
jgi:hypothetical protein